MPSAGQIILTCWIVYLAYWTAQGWGNKPVAERQHWREFAANRVPLLIGAILLVGKWSRVPLLGIGAPGSPEVGAALCVAGVAVAIWARRTLAGNWSATVTFKQDHELIERGPYRFVRHPIYTGILLMLLGTALARGLVASWLGFACMAAGFWIKLRQEERLMVRHFGETYREYGKRVKALVPFVV